MEILARLLEADITPATPDTRQAEIGLQADAAEVLLVGPKASDDIVAVLEEVESERKADFGRGVDLGA